MTITYTWKITGLKVKDTTDVLNAVVQTYWTKTGVDAEGNEGTFSGATPLDLNLGEGKFIPFEDLTEEDVLAWVKEIVTGDYEKRVNEEIQKQLDSKAAKDVTLPWAPTPEPTPTSGPEPTL